MKNSQLAMRVNKLVYLSRENEVNKLIRDQHRTKRNLNLLFVSEWDERCNIILSKLDMLYDRRDPLYIINSFQMPHAFVIYGTTKVPELVRLRGNDVRITEYLPRIYTELGL